ncbi:MAG: hypothetical protein ACRDVW_01735 [Acidimicrobiales bacterium]
MAAFILAFFKQAPRIGVTVEPAFVNGGPGIVIYDTRAKIVSVLSLEVSGGVIQAVRGIVNPDKLAHLGDVSDLARISRRDEEHRS